jgi:8-oxo-dGTP pyrophosphatase MutT (NUDIX family)
VRLDVRTALVLRHPDGRQVLLLRRSPGKRLFPGLVTGIGGRVEVERGEAADLDAALWREVAEETAIRADHVEDLRLRLATLESRGDEQVLLLWFAGRLRGIPADLSCAEGELFFAPVAALPVAEMIPTARQAIRCVLDLPPGDVAARAGHFTASGRLVLDG